MFYAAQASRPRVLATKQVLGLSGNEKVLSTTLLQIKIERCCNFGLASTVTGRILAIDTAASARRLCGLHAVTERAGSTTPATQCDGRAAVLDPCELEVGRLPDRSRLRQALSLEPHLRPASRSSSSIRRTTATT
jgi:hypothetical protein